MAGGGIIVIGLESRAQRAMRENNVANDLADLVLEEEELPF